MPLSMGIPMGPWQFPWAHGNAYGPLGFIHGGAHGHSHGSMGMLMGPRGSFMEVYRHLPRGPLDLKFKIQYISAKTMILSKSNLAPNGP